MAVTRKHLSKFSRIVKLHIDNAKLYCDIFSPKIATNLLITAVTNSSNARLSDRKTKLVLGLTSVYFPIDIIEYPVSVTVTLFEKRPDGTLYQFDSKVLNVNCP